MQCLWQLWTYLALQLHQYMPGNWMVFNMHLQCPVSNSDRIKVLKTGFYTQGFLCVGRGFSRRLCSLKNFLETPELRALPWRWKNFLETPELRALPWRWKNFLETPELRALPWRWKNLVCLDMRNFLNLPRNWTSKQI